MPRGSTLTREMSELDTCLANCITAWLNSDSNDCFDMQRADQNDRFAVRACYFTLRGQRLKYRDFYDEDRSQENIVVKSYLSL